MVKDLDCGDQVHLIIHVADTLGEVGVLPVEGESLIVVAYPLAEFAPNDYCGTR